MKITKTSNKNNYLPYYFFLYIKLNQFHSNHLKNPPNNTSKPKNILHINITSAEGTPPLLQEEMAKHCDEMVALQLMESKLASFRVASESEPRRRPAKEAASGHLPA